MTVGSGANNGTLVLGGANTYTGATTISVGAVQAGVSSTATSGPLGVGSAVTVTSTFQLETFNVSILSLAGAGTVNNGGSTNATLSIGAAAKTFSTTFTGALANGGAGTLALTMVADTSPGTLKLSGTDTYTGATTVSGSYLDFTVATALPAATTITVNSGGTVAAGYAINQAFLGQIAPASAGVIALGIASSNNLNFNTAGLSLASLAPSVHSLTPAR